MGVRYVLRVKDPDIRRAEIDVRQLESSKAGHKRKEYKFRAGGTDLPLISLPIDYLIYRLENYRTRDTQLSWIAAGKVADGFFNPSRREDPAVQIKQHEILVAQAKQGSGETIKPIFAELERVREQTEELIISADGVVVNGNRRLSAMRELFASDPSEFSRFADVQCAVLPASATVEEILRLEIGLQMQPETKLPYEWTALGRAVRDLRDAQMPDDAIALLMNRDKPDIVRAAKMIDSADLYLGDWLDKPNSYDLLDDTEQAFKQIATRNLGRSDDAPIREVTRQFDFLVVEQREEITERAYALINAIEDNPTLFLDTLATELSIDVGASQPSNTSTHKITFDTPPTATKNYDLLINALTTSREDEESAKTLVKTVEQVCLLVAEQGKKREDAALAFAKRAEKNLAAIDIQTASTSTYNEIRNCLERCIKLGEQLLGDIGTRQASKGK